MNLNVRKKMLTLLMATTLTLNRGIIKANARESFDKGDYLRTTANLNIRIDANVESLKIGLIDKDKVVYRILSYDNGWDLVFCDNIIGFVQSSYLNKITSHKDLVVHKKTEDLVFFNDNVNFRLRPTVEGEKISVIKKGERALVIADTNIGWYLISYNGKIGYVYGEYVSSLQKKVKELYPYFDIDGIDLSTVAYATSNLNVRTGNGTSHLKIGSLNKFESVYVLSEYDGWYLILNNDNLCGFVDKKYIQKIDDSFVIIDISEQHLWLYKDNNLILSTDVVTGKNETPTYVGLFKIKKKERDRYLTGDDYHVFVNYWMPFNGGIGLHDASWRNRFGGSIYQNDGSHGCVNMPSNISDDVYENVEVGTKVLVHK